MNPTGKGGFKEHPELINKGGRPKDVFTPLLAKKYADTVCAQEVVDKLHELAADGNMTAIAYIVDRFLGKPRQAVEVSGGDEPVGLIFVNPGETTETTSPTPSS
jgi:hypothetical protein